MNSIKIVDVISEESAIPYLWKSPGDFYNLKSFDQEIYFKDNPSWIEELGDLSKIIRIWICSHLRSDEFKFLYKLDNVEEIVIADASNLTSLEFINNKIKLHTLFINNSNIEELDPVIKLRNLQTEDKLRAFKEAKGLGKLPSYIRRLDKVAVTNSKIKSLDIFREFDESFEELNLKGNQITDLSPLDHMSISYLSVKKVEGKQIWQM